MDKGIDSNLSVVIAGNVYIRHSLMVHKEEKGFLELLRLLQMADTGVANLECAVDADQHWPAFGGGMGWSGTPMSAPRSMLAELKEMGFGGVFAANNHSSDFAEGGLITTLEALDEADLKQAGIGRNMHEAARPAYIETPHGRVAIISACDWGPRRLMELPFPWPAGYMPSDELPPFHSRPGVNLVRYDVVAHVMPGDLDVLRHISAAYSWEKAKTTRRNGGGRTETLIGPTLINYEVDTDREFFFMGRKFVADDDYRLETFAFQEDLDRIYTSVSEARKQADAVIVGLHDQSHGMGVLDFIHTLAHGCIDAGADIYVNHGGRPRGIELYNGGAILYGQTDFHLQNEQATEIPSEMLKRIGLQPGAGSSEFIQARRDSEAAALAEGGHNPHIADKDKYIQVVHFDDVGDLVEIQIYPLQDKMVGASRRKGPPQLLPDGAEAMQYLTQFKERCATFDTKVEIDHGVGVVRVK